MSRWGPDADGRLYRAAMELIFERGYDEVTVAEIAEHAGLKKRSFFRYFADKREVLFAGAADFEHAVVDAVHAAPATELRERELIKMDALTTAVAGALRHRGVEDLTATLVAQVGVAAFQTAFQQWTEAPDPQDLTASMDDVHARLRSALCDPP